MKYTISLILLILLIGCTKNNVCDNKFDFISSTDTIPILNFDIKTPYYLTRNDISNLYYNADLCELCSRIEFKIPFDIESKNGFLKIMTDFDTPYCSNCPIPNRFRDYYRININKKDQLLVEDQLISIQSLESNIEKYIQGISENDTNSKSFSHVNYLIHWEKGSNQIFLDSILTKIYNAHLNNVEIKIHKFNKDFCLLSKKELIDLKNDYPLRIEFDLGKFEKMKENIERNYKIKVENISL